MRVFWTGQDVLIWIGLGIPSLLLASMISRLIPWWGPAQPLVAQFLWFFLWFLLLKLLFLLKYDEKFWPALGWVMPSKGLWICLLGGPILEVGLSLAAQWMKAPLVDAPFKELLLDRRLRYVFGVAGVLLAPLCEELAFRGFIMPLLAKWLGVAGGIIATGALFGLAHGQQYHWSWQHVVLLAATGCVLGFVRWKYSSTMASMVLHSSFNLTTFLAHILYG